MKKLEKLTLKSLGIDATLIGFTEAKTLNGGTTFEEYQVLAADGSWSGGIVDNWGLYSRRLLCF